MNKGIEIKSFRSPDEHRPFNQGKGYLDVVRIGGQDVGLGVFQPGWRWSSHVKPIAGTDSCQSAHRGYVVSGRLHVVMNDGQQADLSAGDFALIQPGHDAWVVGDEPCVIFDFAGFSDYARPSAGPAATYEPAPVH
ncbi:MAG TPA: cupin domain-containing protein [Myxococcales bacterium]|jgi:quercetin dioxygenase-like cupin family protein